MLKMGMSEMQQRRKTDKIDSNRLPFNWAIKQTPIKQIVNAQRFTVLLLALAERMPNLCKFNIIYVKIHCPSHSNESLKGKSERFPTTPDIESIFLTSLIVKYQYFLSYLITRL